MARAGVFYFIDGLPLDDGIVFGIRDAMEPQRIPKRHRDEGQRGRAPSLSYQLLCLDWFILWSCELREKGWLLLVRSSQVPFRAPAGFLILGCMISIKDIPWVQLLKENHYHPSPRDWSDQVIYFLLIDRFSDGAEDGYKDVAGQIVHGTTELFSPGDAGNAVQTQTDIENWESAGTQWLGGSLKGIQSKIGYL